MYVGRLQFYKIEAPYSYSTPYMEFPITRERLQNFKKESVTIAARRQLEEVLSYFRRSIEYEASRGSLRHVYHFRGGGIPLLPKSELTQNVLEELRVLLPDSKITMDPLETYILIDWS